MNATAAHPSYQQASATSQEKCTRKPESISSTSLEVLAQRPKAAREMGTFKVIRHRQLTLSHTFCEMKFVPNYCNNIPGL